MRTIPIKPAALRPEEKCGLCTNSTCCTYITQPIDTPRSMSDFDHLAWQLAHPGIEAYRDSDGWYLLVKTVCSHLGADGRCGIYERRPQICRDYSNDYCEFDEPAENGFELHFRSDEELAQYCRTRFKNWDRRFRK